MPKPSVERERRTQILETATACFARKGYHQTTMEEIAAQTPFSKGLIYYYFKSKRELFMAILDEWMARTEQAWQALLSPQDSAADKLRKCAQFPQQLMVEASDFVQVQMEFWAEAGREREVSAKFQQIFAAYRSILSDIIEEGIAAGEFKAVDSSAVASFLMAAYCGQVLLWMIDNEAFDWQEVSETLVESVLHGIANGR
ncbi:MAG: TetR/AcrR family transcriptional regulator [Anaerolineae bacterium]